MVRRGAGAAILMLLLPLLAWAGQADVQGVRMWPAPDNTRVVFDLSGPVDHKLFPLDNPPRVVVDIEDVRLDGGITGLKFDGSLVKDIRSAPRNGDDLRVVFDLSGKVHPKSFLLQPNRKYGHRLVIDLHEPDKGKPVVKARSDPSKPRALLIAIDPGHGGEDPGAVGRRGTHEKDVVLAIGRRLKKLLDREPGMRGYLTRDGDYFVSLRKRVQKARARQADMFVSLHADGFPDPRAKGASVYILSPHGASSEHARWLARKENQSDLVGGVSLEDKDDVLASVLLDLSQTASIEASHNAADRVLGRIDRVARLHKRKVERAGFLVLKAPDMPSMLVETAFITNPTEERNLRSSRYQHKLARAVVGGIKEYFAGNAPPGTVMARAPQTHTITRGDTLSEIARTYRVSLDSLRSANNLRGDRIRIGQVLQIPSGS